MNFCITCTFIFLLACLQNVHGNYATFRVESDSLLRLDNEPEIEFVQNMAAETVQISAENVLVSASALLDYNEGFAEDNEEAPKLLDDLAPTIVGGVYDSLFEEPKLRASDSTLNKNRQNEESKYTVRNFEDDIAIEEDFLAITERDNLKRPCYVERLKPQMRTIGMQLNDIYIHNLTYRSETFNDSNKTRIGARVDPDRKLSPTVDLPTVQLKDARYCDGHLVQNNQISWSPSVSCPYNMMKKPMALKIECKSIQRESKS